jgi:hypothetical protein
MTHARKLLPRLLAAVTLMSGLLVGTSDATAAPFACIGAPSSDPGVGYGPGLYDEPRMFIEGQSWWSNRTSHAHLGACVPADQHLKGPVVTNFLVQFHGMSGYASKLFQKVSTDTCSTCGEQLTFQNTVNTAFSNVAPNDSRYWITTTYNPAVASDHSGWQGVKQRLEIRNPDGTIVRPAIRYMAYLDNGKSLDHYSRAWTDAYGWDTKTAYAHGIVLPATKSPYSGTMRYASVSGTYTFTAKHESTTDGVSDNVTAWDVSVDPALHAVPPSMGMVLGSGTTTCTPYVKGTCQGPTTTYHLDTTRLTNGIHYVTIFTHNKFSSTQENTGVLKYPIVVQNP